MNLAEQLNSGQPETLPSRLMPDILERLQSVPRLMVLDVGLGVHETVAFFGDRRCRLHFAGIHDALHSPPRVEHQRQPGQLVDKQVEEAASYEAWRQHFAQSMNYPPDTRFDVCLLWDLFNYLDDIAIKAFADVLSPYLSDQTLAHAYLLLKADNGFSSREYGIKSAGEIAIRAGAHNSLDCFPRPQARVTSMISDFSVNHSVLRRDGLLEVSLRSKTGTAR